MIPGTCWAGAFRRHASGILLKASKSEEDAVRFIDELFGYEIKLKDGELNPVKDDKNKISKSKIIFSESVIPRGSVTAINRTRCAIDRFTGSALDQALFTDRMICAKSDKDEKPEENSAIPLEIGIDRTVSDLKLAKSLIEVCIDDLCRGILSIGGNTASGSGIFYSEGEDKKDE